MLGYQFSSNSSIDSKNFSLNYNTVAICKCVKTDMLNLKFVWKTDTLTLGYKTYKTKRPIRPKITWKTKKVTVIMFPDFNPYYKT